jgi:hypothetical protein
MTVTVPMVLIAGFVVVILCRYVGLKAWQAIVCVLFGLLLAATVYGVAISHLLATATSLF